MQIALADQSVTIRSALRLLIEMETDLSVAGEADNGGGLVEILAAKRPELVMVDWDLPGIDLVFNGGIKRDDLAGKARLIVLGNDPQARETALARGAHYFVCKGESPERLLEAIHAAAAAVIVTDKPDTGS